LLAAGCGGDEKGGSRENPDGSISIDLVEQSDSGQSGEATMRAVDDERTRVVIKLSGAPTGPEPAHIHERACDDIDPTPTDGLQPVVGGRSETIISVSLNHLRSSPHAINVHKSTDALDDYVACGTIGEGGSLLP
jgi:hypothetical protein